MIKRKGLSGDRNQCPGCGELFNSTLAFDRHRTGDHGIDRRCRTEAEMIQRGMSKNAAGFWITASNPRFPLPHPESASLLGSGLGPVAH